MMKAVSPVNSREAAIRCMVCRTHSCPLYVPWDQHAIGCPVRAVALERREPEPRSPLRIVSGIATV